MDEDAYAVLIYLASDVELTESEIEAILHISKKKGIKVLNALARREYIHEPSHRVWELTSKGCLFIGEYLSERPLSYEDQIVNGTYQDFTDPVVDTQKGTTNVTSIPRPHGASTLGRQRRKDDVPDRRAKRAKGGNP